jgi:hypothetical protein
MPEWITAIAALVAALATVAHFIATVLIFRYNWQSNSDRPRRWSSPKPTLIFLTLRTTC